MYQNKVIGYGIWLSWVIYGLCIFFFLLLTLVTIYWHINMEAFSRVEVSEALKAGYGIKDFRIISNIDPSNNAVLLSELNHGMIYWIYARGVFFFGITLLMVRKIISVLHSIKNLETFYSDNIEHFRVLARLGFIAFLVSCINFSYLNGELHISLSIVFGPLFFSVSCLILSEVFREGKTLLEDNNMII